MKRKQGNKQCREHHHMEREEPLHGKLRDVRAAAQQIGNRRTDAGNRRRYLQTNLGGEVAQLVHGQQVAGKTETRGQAQQRHAR